MKLVLFAMNYRFSSLFFPEEVDGLGVEWSITHDDIRRGDFSLEVVFYW